METANGAPTTGVIRTRTVDVALQKREQSASISPRSLNLPPTTSARKVALAVDPYEVQKSVSGISGMSSLAYQYQHQTQQSKRNDSPSNNSTNSNWHDERLLKSFQNSSTYQKRLGEQAAEAFRKAEEQTAQNIEKKIQNCLNTLDVVGKRKKNDLKLIELRKKAEIEKFEKAFRKMVFEKEIQELRELQDSLKEQVLDLKAQNTVLREQCCSLVTQNKQLMAEEESNEAVQKEVAQYGEIRAQLESINQIIRESHEAAVADLKRLELDCQKEAAEKKKLQNWVPALIKLMEERCRQPKLVARIRRIDAKAREQRVLVQNLRRSKKSCSKRSTRSGNTAVLNEKVEDMRRRAGKPRILEDEMRECGTEKNRKKEKKQDIVGVIYEVNDLIVDNSLIEEEEEDRGLSSQ